MLKEKEQKVSQLRHAEYYNMQEIFDNLYAKSCENEKFTSLADIAFCKENILLAYRNIKQNSGSHTPGTDGITIEDIGKIPVDEMVNFVQNIVFNKNGYKPKPVRRKDIPKTGDKTQTRPLGIPCMWDRIIQQCIKQVMEPICEAKFYKHSYGFRPNCSVEHAIARAMFLMQQCNLHYVVEFDIKGFFDNVNHSKLIKQIWAMGIQDKTMVYILKQILKAPIKMPNNDTVYPTKGTPQGGIISPLLANIVLNELDQWVVSQWEHHPVADKFTVSYRSNGTRDYSNAYAGMRRSRLKEMYIVRYADDFRVFCRDQQTAEKILKATTMWLKERLKLEVSLDKTRIVNTQKDYMRFLGFKLRVHLKGKKERGIKQRAEYEKRQKKQDVETWRKDNPNKTKTDCRRETGMDPETIRKYWDDPKAAPLVNASKIKYVVESRIDDKALNNVKTELKHQIKKIKHSANKYEMFKEINRYNAMVLGIQNYYWIATNVNKDLSPVQNQVRILWHNGMINGRNDKILKTGRPLTSFEAKRYGKSETLIYSATTYQPIYPIGYVQTHHPMCKNPNITPYTKEGRDLVHKNLQANMQLMLKMMENPVRHESIEYNDNRISLFCAQQGKCYITGQEFTNTADIHCHHKVPKSQGGTDKYDNLVLLSEPVHKLVHATDDDIIRKYKKYLSLNKSQTDKLNKLRKIMKLAEI